MVKNVALVLLFLKFMFCFCDGEHLNITRIGRMWYYGGGGDEFQVPPSLYGGNESKCSNSCSLMGGKHVRSLYRVKPYCKCKCILPNKTVGFFDRKWNCANDNDISQNAGCSIISTAIDGNKIPTLTFEHLSKLLKFEDKFSNKDGICNSFELKKNNLSYFACDGAWKPLNYSSLENSFEIAIVQKTQELTIMFADRMKPLYQPIDPLLPGRIIKLGIECSSPLKRSTCLLVKVEGKLSCPLQLSSPSVTTSVTPTPLTEPTAPLNWSVLPPVLVFGHTIEPTTYSSRVSLTRGSWFSIASSVSVWIFVVKPCIVA